MSTRVSFAALGALLLIGLSPLAVHRGAAPGPRPEGPPPTAEQGALGRHLDQQATERAPGGATDEPRAAPAPEAPGSIEQLLEREGAVSWTTAARLFAAGTESCVDGRSQAPVIGTPGGDVGDLLLSLAALESAAGKPVDGDRLDALVDAYVEVFGRFYLHTDAHALVRLRDSLRRRPGYEALERAATPEAIRRFVVAPPVELEGPLLDALVVPEHVGCGHLRQVLREPSAYGVRAGLPGALLKAVFRHAFAHPDDLDFVVLDGEHEERGVLIVRQRNPVEAHSRVPMVTPHGALAEYFVFHPDVASYFRKETASFLADRHEQLGLPEPDRAALAEAVDSLGARQLEETLGRLAPGLPRTEVHLAEETRAHRRAGREVSARR